MHELEAMIERRKRAEATAGKCPACPHGYLVHGARGCWKCGCPVSWSELSSRAVIVDSAHFPGAKHD